MPVLSRATCPTCPSASQWSSSLSPLVVVAKARIDFSTVLIALAQQPTSYDGFLVHIQTTTAFIHDLHSLSPFFQEQLLLVRQSHQVERREVREQNTQVPSRAPLHHRGRHLSLRNAPGSASNAGSLTPSFNDLVSPLCWILPHFHADLSRRCHGASNDNTGLMTITSNVHRNFFAPN